MVILVTTSTGYKRLLKYLIDNQYEFTKEKAKSGIYFRIRC
jgi:hypothetical protein